VRNGIALLNLQFYEDGADEEDLIHFLADLASENPADPFENFALRLVEGVLDLAQFLVLLRYDETGLAPARTFAELGLVFAEPVEREE
jgi:hypothetical protein